MKRHEIPMYGGTLVVCATAEEAEAVFHDLDGREPPDERSASGRDGEVLRGQHGGELLLVAGVYCDAHDVACHEAVHCAQYVAERVGMHPINELEAFAYLTQWVFVRLVEVMREGVAA